MTQCNGMPPLSALNALAQKRSRKLCSFSVAADLLLSAIEFMTETSFVSFLLRCSLSDDREMRCEYFLRRNDERPADRPEPGERRGTAKAFAECILFIFIYVINSVLMKVECTFRHCRARVLLGRSSERLCVWLSPNIRLNFVGRRFVVLP